MESVLTYDLQEDEDRLREAYAFVADQLLTDAHDFGERNAVNLFEANARQLEKEAIDLGCVMAIGAYDAGMRYQGFAEEAITIALRWLERSYRETLFTLLADATLGLVH